MKQYEFYRAESYGIDAVCVDTGKTEPYDWSGVPVYLCDDVDPVIRELRALVLYEKGLHNLNMANRIGVGAPAYEKRVKIGYLQLHYAQLIRENKPGWWLL